ncbi:inheritance of peroxisomes protein 1-domain-containing protein [Scheffersomyces xylosifermentans]|uniref:inheritance of peroxisomes protein 1-domain-containing protein n=1 Tax=Scheffersomyces xylosifermentans TaxID=1304137 RepID=UPI00315D6491
MALEAPSLSQDNNREMRCNGVTSGRNGPDFGLSTAPASRKGPDVTHNEVSPQKNTENSGKPPVLSSSAKRKKRRGKYKNKTLRVNHKSTNPDDATGETSPEEPNGTITNLKNDTVVGDSGNTITIGDLQSFPSLRETNNNNYNNRTKTSNLRTPESNNNINSYSNVITPNQISNNFDTDNLDHDYENNNNSNNNNNNISENSNNLGSQPQPQNTLQPPLRVKPTEGFHSTYVSPRKQAIMRYRKSGEFSAQTSQIAEAKENLKRSPTSQANTTEKNPDKSIPSSNLNLEDRVTLFKYKSAKILVVDEQLSEKNSNSSGRLLGHGDFEIFQLHNGDVNYLSCGPSFIYPLLPKLKILRVSFNQFILPLVNPERYWKIFINTEESNVIDVIENTFQRVVKYRNLYFDNNIRQSGERSPDAQLNDVSAIQLRLGSELYSNSINERPDELHALSIIDESDSNYNSNNTTNSSIPALNTNQVGANNTQSLPHTNYNFPTISTIIPDSPPSAPISPPPHGNASNSIDFAVSPTKNIDPFYLLTKKASMQSISTSVACLDLNSKTTIVPTAIVSNNNKPGVASSNIHTSTSIGNISLKSNHNGRGFYKTQGADLASFNKKDIHRSVLHQPKPKRTNHNNHYNANPYSSPSLIKESDEKSDSSMDSLLDEYEENITYTKSVTRSRPASRQPSIISASLSKLPNYSRGSYFPGHIDNDDKSSHGMTQEGDLEDFPTTSLSAYNRVHNDRPGATRSRRSSRSELYAAESNWMEPNMDFNSNPNRILKSRSNYSLNSAQSVDLNNTYKNIYKSITQRSLKHYDDDTRSSKSHKLPTITAHVRSDFTNSSIAGSNRGSNSLSRKSSYATSVKSERNFSSAREPNSKRSGDLKLDSNEIYNLISSTRRPITAASKANDLREVRGNPPPKSSSFASRLFGW